jgi:hypothetical protein
MAKQIKHDFNKNKQNTPKNTSDTSKVVQMKTDVQKNTSQNLTDGLVQFSDVTKKVLLEKFGMTCDIKEVKLSANFTTFHITKKGLKPEAEGQVKITMGKDLTSNIHLNPYDGHYGEYYFYGEKLESKDLTAEFDNFEKFMNTGEFTEHGKFKKEVNYDPNTVDEELLAGDHKVK